MSKNELMRLCSQYKDLKRMQEEIAEELEAVADAIKSAMGDAELIRVGEYKITHKTVNGSRLDTSGIRRECPDIAARFTLPTVSKRFQII